MRIYEFSKKSGIPSTEIVKKLQDAGFDVSSHMSSLSEKAIQFLEKKDASPAKENKKQVSVEQKAKKPQSIAKKIEEKGVDSKEDEVLESGPVVLLEPTKLVDIAQAINQPVNDIIMVLLRWGILANKNQILPIDVIQRVATHFEVATKKSTGSKRKILKKITHDKDLQDRLPIIVVLGHVDHGKTTLLDHIRKTRVTAKEKGGITQHLGAYQADTKQGSIVFLDTPGHEAFSKIRERGSHVADIAILVVAADDSIMPQTIEAIKFAREANIPIIVAINKIDKASTVQVESVKRDLSQHDLLPEEWGGTTICVPISAKEGTGIDQLLEMVALQAELMELQAKQKGVATGYILESRLEKGRGPVATILIQQGQISLGDYFVCGQTRGKVSSLTDSFGEQLKTVGPSVPVLVAGFEKLPEPGDLFKGASKSEYRKGLSQIEEIATVKFIPQDSINIIVKTDTLSSKEALVESIAKLSRKIKKDVGKGFNIIFAGIGDVNESDVTLASSTAASIIGLHVKTNPSAGLLAQKLAIDITIFDIIYKLLEQLEENAIRAKVVKIIKKKLGEAIVLRVFKIKNVGVIAGCYIRDGKFSRDGFVEVLRDGVKIGGGAIKSLQREKKDFKEISSGYECAFMVEGFNDWQVDDLVECYINIPES